jgi:hypothetical protein
MIHKQAYQYYNLTSPSIGHHPHHPGSVLGTVFLNISSCIFHLIQYNGDDAHLPYLFSFLLFCICFVFLCTGFCVQLFLCFLFILIFLEGCFMFAFFYFFFFILVFFLYILFCIFCCIFCPINVFMLQKMLLTIIFYFKVGYLSHTMALIYQHS